MKQLTSTQQIIINCLIGQLSAWKNTNDISSPTHYSDMNDFYAANLGEILSEEDISKLTVITCDLLQFIKPCSMTQEDKELLLKDISGRLPYCPIVQISLYRNDGIRSDIDLDPRVTENIWEIIDKYHALPYLRPMSSMTEEERKEYKHLVAFSGSPDGAANFIDWLNVHHFDYRGLIPKGLAIAVTEENNPYRK